MRRRATLSLLGCLAPLVVGCLPYSVGSTARPLPAHESVKTGSLYFIPNAVDREGDSAAVSLRGFDGEVRRGIDARSDWGLRITSGSGVVLSYKRLLGEPAPSAAAVAFETSGGIVNFGEHAMLGGTLIASGAERADVTPYGGLRVIAVTPMSRGAVHDAPSIGAFVGARLGRRSYGVSPELGVFRDPSALGIRKGSLLLVPSVSVHGEELWDAIGDLLRF